jgi:hypothetical protein
MNIRKPLTTRQCLKYDTVARPALGLGQVLTQLYGRVRGRWRSVNSQTKQMRTLRMRQKARGPINLLRTMPKASVTVTLCLR